MPLHSYSFALFSILMLIMYHVSNHGYIHMTLNIFWTYLVVWNAVFTWTCKQIWNEDTMMKWARSVQCVSAKRRGIEWNGTSLTGRTITRCRRSASAILERFESGEKHLPVCSAQEIFCTFHSWTHRLETQRPRFQSDTTNNEKLLLTLYVTVYMFLKWCMCAMLA